MLSKHWGSLIKPLKLAVINPDENLNIGIIVVEPLERGFGITLGNALRRVLLSSIQGAAVTAIRVYGVTHEFSTIPGVKEDLVDIILNIKSMIVKMYGFEKKSIKLNVTGPCVVTAGMINTTHDIEIVNKNLVLCTLAKGFKLDIEFICETGKGYVEASAEGKDMPIGTIFIDALFSPVKKVSYNIEKTRVGQITDYDKLILTIETNGTTTPDTAAGIAAKILQDQLQLFINFEEVEHTKEEKQSTLPFNPILLKKVDELELSVRSQNCLKNDNIVYIGDLVIKPEAEMLKTPNFGRKSLNEIKAILDMLGLKFGMHVSAWPPENLDELAKSYEEEIYIKSK